MPRTRCPESIEAEELYHKGMSLVEIAKKLGKPEGTVRRWKSTQAWDGNKKKQSERSGKKKTNVRKCGAPKGNKNAQGHGAPERNQNALKHGGYSDVYWDFLREGEEALLNTPEDEEILLLEQIRLFNIRERRIMLAINKYMDVSSGQYISGALKIEDKRVFKNTTEKSEYELIVKKKVMNEERLPGEKYNQQTTTQATIDLIARLEKELTSIQSKKTKAIDTLSKLHIEKQKIEGENKGNDFVRTWAENVLKSRRERNGK